ncbi:MAG: protein serine/threonine phosphatase [Mycobacterium sp.]|nr:protein serine/threonine phosphatase [Mycobacterium sp.]
MGDNLPAGYATALHGVLQTGHLVAPDQLAQLISQGACHLGAKRTTLYLVDYEQRTLSPLLATPDPDRQPLSVEATLAGRAFRTVTPLVSDPDTKDRVRLWIPLLDGVERLGVVEFVIARDRPLSQGDREAFGQFAHLAAELVVTNGMYTDVYEWTRRREPMSLAAEMQHSLLPPLTFGTDRIVISGLLAPAYEVGGDAYDYALNGPIAHVAVFDAIGHGLQASLLAQLTVAAYRNGRRAGLDLADTAQQIDDALASQFGAERYATALLAQLNIETGLLRWVNAGHPAPMLLRDGHVVKELHCEPLLPLGLNGLVGDQQLIRGAQVAEESLQPGDRLLFLTDGVDEARTENGEFFGRKRLAEFAAREAASGLPTPEVMRRLQQSILRHLTQGLQDDATTLFVEWLGGSEKLTT